MIHISRALRPRLGTTICAYPARRDGDSGDFGLALRFCVGWPGAFRSLVLTSTDKPEGQRGFTLLELLVVLAIIGLLVGLVAPAALHQLGSAKEKIAHQSIERLATVLDMFKLDVGRYPTTEQGLQALITPPTGVSRWSGPYLKGDKLPEDPWGHPFVYRSPSQRPNHEFDLYSLGPNGQAAGPGDASAIYNE